jgi:hypothetical protein
MDVGAPCCKCYVPCFAHSEAKYHSHEVTVFTPWHPRCKHYFFAIAWLSENFSCYYDVEVILSENYAVLQNLFQFLASSYCTCAFSHCSTFCDMHQGDTALAVLRRDAFRGIESECAEYGIKLGTQSQILKCMNVPHGHLSSLLYSFCSLGDSCFSRVYASVRISVHWPFQYTSFST